MAAPFRISLVELANAGSRAFLPTGLCYLSAYLKKNFGNRVAVQILTIPSGDASAVAATQPDLVGFTAFTHNFPDAVETAGRVKAALPDVPLILGGQHLSMAPWSMPPVFDYGVVGEGERTLCELVDFIRSGAPVAERSKLRGVQYVEEGRLIALSRQELITPLDAIPFPDRGAIADIEASITADQFFLFDRDRTRSMQLTTSRGCPYKCRFCQPSLLWHPFRTHSAEYIAEEISFIRSRYAVDAVLVEDDLFTADRKRMQTLLDLLGKKELLGKIRYYVAARAAQLDDEWVRMLKALGVVKVELGIESGSDRIAAYLKTGKASMDVNREAVTRLNRAGISVYAAFMAGAPPETTEDLEATWQMIRWIRRSHVHNTCGISIATPLPGTGLWDDAVARGLIDPATVDWRRLSSLNGAVSSPEGMIYINEHMPPEVLLKRVARMNFRMRLGTVRSFAAFLPRRLRKLAGRLLKAAHP